MKWPWERDWSDPMEWLDMFSPAVHLYNQGEKVYEARDDPEAWNDLYDDVELLPLTPVLDWWKNKKIREETEQWYDDLDKNSGQSWRNSVYPWKTYYEDGPGSVGTRGSTTDLFEASTSVINFYRKRW